MKMKTRILLAGIAATAVVAPASASMAGQDIGWTWNSDDRDVRGKFVSNGDNFHSEEHNGNGYIDWTSGVNGSGRWFVPGAATGALKVLNLELTENKSVSMKVCEEKGGWPDDCSTTKYGVS